MKPSINPSPAEKKRIDAWAEKQALIAESIELFRALGSRGVGPRRHRRAKGRNTIKALKKRKLKRQTQAGAVPVRARSVEHARLFATPALDETWADKKRRQRVLETFVRA